jgi:hypothetical protein
MKRKLLVSVMMTCFILSSCSKIDKQQVANTQLSNAQKTTIEYSNSTIQKEEGANNVDDWELVDKKSCDIDNDGKENSIVLYWFNGSDSAPKLKLRIDVKEKVFEFNPTKTIAINSVNLKQFVNLDNNNKGILIKLNSEGETENQDSEDSPPCWFDHSFLIIGYINSEITTILDGVNQPFNSKDNYIVTYMGDYNIGFKDKATGFNAQYVVGYYKSQVDGIKKLQLINDNQTYPISRNYFNVKSQDTNNDGVDEIICSKYIPGLYHNDSLGTIDYTFTFKKGKYYLSNEALRYDGRSGMSIIKQMEIK